MRTEEIIAEIDLKSFHQTGNTRHYRRGKLLPSASTLRLIRFDGKPDMYLIHYDNHGEEMIDTCHDSIEEALEQAEWEYEIKKEQWTFK